MSFSERMKFVPEKSIQIDDIDIILRNRIINKIEELFSDAQARKVLDFLGYRVDNTDFFKEKNLKKLADFLEKLPWYRVYDVIEYGFEILTEECLECSDKCDETYYDEENKLHYDCEIKEQSVEYKNVFNSVLERGKSGYRLVNGIISPITNEEEIESIDKATNTQFYSVNIHIQKALQFYADREAPDYENSIKESISAVEAMCCIITGMTGASATLGAALKKLEDNGVVIHSALREAFSKMYGYTSDADGIRHGGIDFENAPSEDAKYMLISCSSFVNYLIEKYGKII